MSESILFVFLKLLLNLAPEQTQKKVEISDTTL